MIDYGLWAVGALTIGLGILPVVAASRPVPAAGRGPDSRATGVRTVLAASAVGFGLYTAVKAAYVSTPSRP